VLGGVLALLAAAAELGLPLAAREVIDRLGSSASAAGPILVLSGLVVASAVFSGLNAWVLARTGERVVREARRRMGRQLLGVRVAELLHRPPGDLGARMVSDTTLLRQVTTSTVVDAAAAAVTLVGAVILMGFLDLALLGVTMGAVAAVALCLVVVLPRVRRATERAQAAVGTTGAALDRALGAIRTIKASGAEDREAALIGAAADDAYRHGITAAGWGAVAAAVGALAVQGAFLAVLGLGGARVAEGSLDVGTLVAFLLYLFWMIGPLSQLARAATQVQDGLAAVARIEEVAALEPEPRHAPPAPPPVPGAPALRIENVSFRYAGAARDALRDVTFSVPDTGLTALVGPSGAGKTTLLALIERFFEPAAGRILLGGVDSARMPLPALRAQVGYVEQETPVLDGTLRENLLLAAPEATAADLAEVIAATRLDELVRGLPDGLGTAVGPRGVRLSGGERQRVAIARALLRRPRLLVLDEATAHLDGVNEAALQRAVAAAGERAAVLVVAHRLSTVRAAGRIVVLDEGEVRAVGTHAELVAESPLYRELARAQFLDGEVPASTAVDAERERSPAV
jgi:ATP-binding cassette subfamily C protein